MKHIFQTIIFVCLCGINSYGQEKFEAYVAKHTIDTNYLKSVDADNLFSIIAKSDKKLNWVAIYTNYCAGTKHILSNVKKTIEEYKGVNIVLCSSAPYKEIPDLFKVLRKYDINITPVYIINTNRHKEKGDDRYKGFMFRKEICQECQKDIIGVPYSILFDDEGKVVRYGYLHSEELFPIFESYKN